MVCFPLGILNRSRWRLGSCFPACLLVPLEDVDEDYGLEFRVKIRELRSKQSFSSREKQSRHPSPSLVAAWLPQSSQDPRNYLWQNLWCEWKGSSPIDNSFTLSSFCAGTQRPACMHTCTYTFRLFRKKGITGPFMPFNTTDLYLA